MKDFKALAKKTRKKVIEMIYQAGSGHPGGSLSATDLLVGLYFGGFVGREDRFILSAGHLCPAWYAVLGKNTKSLRALGSELQGHPYKKLADFALVSSGSLGQGLSVGAGISLAKKVNGQKGLVWVFSSDGEQQEGQVWEAAMFAAKQGLNNLCLIIDRNYRQIGGETEAITSLEPLKEKYQSFGWRVLEINGHDFGQIINAFEVVSKYNESPVVIIAQTIRGKGVSFMEDQDRYHACSLTKQEYQKAIEELK